MGIGGSVAEGFLSPSAIQQFTSSKSIKGNDDFWKNLFNTTMDIIHLQLESKQTFDALKPYAESLGTYK